MKDFREEKAEALDELGAMVLPRLVKKAFHGCADLTVYTSAGSYAEKYAQKKSPLSGWTILMDVCSCRYKYLLLYKILLLLRQMPKP